jgi:hypothetical protein
LFNVGYGHHGKILPVGKENQADRIAFRAFPVKVVGESFRDGLTLVYQVK